MTQAKEIKLTPHQQNIFDKMIKFAESPNEKIFILRGYAGTGKTTMLKQFINELSERDIPFRLLASTGRAAKILSNATGHSSTTVHGLIYKYDNINQDLEQIVNDRDTYGVDSSGQLFLRFEVCSIKTNNKICYIVDEASMVSDKEDKTATQAIFGSGRLLSDLLSYDPQGKFIFVGDSCQLPPITQKISPALSVDYFSKNFDITAQECELTEVMRQAQGNDIVLSAKKMRQLYHNPQPWKWAKFPFKGYNNIHMLSSQAELIDRYVKDAKSNGFNAATLICYSNHQCSTLTQVLRPLFGKTEHNLQKGDLLLVTQNNILSGLLNGDLVIVEETMNREHRAGLTFLQVKVRELISQKTYNQLLIEEILYHNYTNLTAEQQKELYIDFYIRMKEKKIKQKSLLFEKMMLEDSYLNALRAVFGYALTCHKAQGGEWNHVYLDIPRNLPQIEKPYVYQWMYTAMTRASAELYIIDDFWIL